MVATKAAIDNCSDSGRKRDDHQPHQMQPFCYFRTELLRICAGFCPQQVCCGCGAMRAILKIMVSTFVVALSLPASSFADGFQIDSDQEGLRKFGNEPFFSELAVGDEGYVYISSLCLEGKSLQLISNLSIGTMSEYGYNLKLKREVNNSVTGQIVAGAKVEASDKKRWFSNFGGLHQCSRVADFVSFVPTFLRVISIDGVTDLKALMRSHFNQ